MSGFGWCVALAVMAASRGWGAIAKPNLRVGIGCGDPIRSGRI